MGRYGAALQEPVCEPPNIRQKIAVPSSPPSKPVPTLVSSRFGYTGTHRRRGGTGACRACRDASRLCRAAQKMVPLSSDGAGRACVAHNPAWLSERS